MPGVFTDRETEQLEDRAREMSQFGDLDVEQFLAAFNLPSIEDPVEKAKRSEILRRNQARVLAANKAFLAGQQSWSEEINEFSHLTDQEFREAHTGLITSGLPGDEKSRGFSEQSQGLMKYDPPLPIRCPDCPAEYSSLDKGWVSPVKDQKQCKASWAFGQSYPLIIH